MQLEVGLLFHVFAVVGPELASAFCACTIVPTLGTVLDVIDSINPYQAAGKKQRRQRRCRS